MKKVNYKHTFILSLIFIILGIVLNVTGSESEGTSTGTVFTAIGGFFLIAALAKKQQENLSNNQ